MEQRTEARVLFVLSFLLSIALALFGFFAPYRWHDMPNWLVNSALLLALFLLVLTILFAIPSPAKGAKKLLAAILITGGLCATITGAVLYFDRGSFWTIQRGSGSAEPQNGPATGTEVASARLSYDGSNFTVISQSKEIKSINIKAAGFSMTDQSFTFQVAFFSGYGPFDYSLKAKDNRWFTSDYWTISVLTVPLEDSDNFVEFRIPNTSLFLLPLPGIMTGPTDMRLSFRKR
jgi:hypothetical protein